MRGSFYVPLSKDDVTEFLAQHFNLEAQVLGENLPLFSSGLLDSTSMVELVAFLEEKASVTIDATDLTLDNFDTVSSILSFCNARA